MSLCTRITTLNETRVALEIRLEMETCFQREVKRGSALPRTTDTPFGLMPTSSTVARLPTVKAPDVTQADSEYRLPRLG